ncbi:MAG: hypothetical protein M1548_04805, partial [Actinobacteria bacterium]|nr:hypothetical protein [Actinomycetota bacterium]
GSVNWGSYQGIGTWRTGAAPFYNQSWARDMGRSLLEMIRLGYLAKAEAGVKFVDSHLYDLPNGYPAINRDGRKVPPHWTTVVGDPLYGDKDGKGDGDQANDGHGLLLLAHYRLWQEKGRDNIWLRDRWPFVQDAAEWFTFQLDNPAFSRATEILYSESEAARDGGYDAYSNFIALKALEKSSEMAASLGQSEFAERWSVYAARLRRGMLRQLVVDDPKYGKVWKPVAWNWSYAHESLAPIIISADADGLELSTADPEMLAISLNTYRQQKGYPNGLASPQTLGYGQSFLTQAALLADDVDSYTEAIANLARFIYYPGEKPYIVPEGVTIHPSGEYWYRNGDLGNAVHQAEVLKTISLMAGVDNLRSGDVRLVPRLPDGWTGMKVVGYPVNDGQAKLSFDLKREPTTIDLNIKLSGQATSTSIRLGPIPPNAKDVKVVTENKTITVRTIQSGRRQWVWLERLAAPPETEIRVELTWVGS